MRILVLTATVALIAAGGASAQSQHGGPRSGGGGSGPSGQGPSGQTPGGQTQPSRPNPPTAGTPAPAPATRNELTLYEGANFQGRQFTYYGPSSDVSRQGFAARSARGSGGVWSVCDSGERNCIQVSGGMANLPMQVATVRVGRNELTLYEGANFQGRQYTWYVASNEIYREGYKPRSARSEGGPWALCEDRGRCVTVSGSLASIDLDVTSARPGSAPAQQSQPGGDRGGRGDAGGGYGQDGRGRDQGGDRGGYPADRNNQGGDRGGYPGDRYNQGGDRGGYPGDRYNQGGDRGGYPSDRYNQGGDRGGSASAGQDLRRVRYSCDGGLNLTAVFDDQDGSVEIRTDREDPVVLDSIRAGQGFRYEGRNRQFYGRGPQAVYAMGRRAPVNCRMR